LPEPYSESTKRSKQQTGRNPGVEPDPARVARFHELDSDKDGKLTPIEFRVNRDPQEATRWFQQRDVNQDGFVDLREYAPRSPLNRP
nr:hypothetical protein [Pirellula sp.]